MESKQRVLDCLAQIPNLHVIEDAPLSRLTRFGIGGPAAIYIETADEAAFIAALTVARDSGAPWSVIGGGTNLIVSDSGFPGIVLRFTKSTIQNAGTCVDVAAGAVLQDLVDYTVERGLKGLETMTGIPGSAGAAVYGNAGAYGHSIMERVVEVRFYDGSGIRTIDNAQCQFRYRESIFKRHKDWIIFSVRLRMDQAVAADLRQTAGGILTIRNEKYPPSMQCAGSIFKNLLLDELPLSARQQVPERVVREGKVPSAYFLEQVGAKGIRNGGIHVADYHANLIYNAGGGTAQQLCSVIADLKSRVVERFGFALEEEVQYVGFEGA
ncbi:MAG TPA: UDP-N-acetylmuramate dehydrogenase [Bryobacteraceae bacterium]|nr:UDP-N-acetylmuramate dehydrogenase [Bryobacteraceae bacterium]